MWETKFSNPGSRVIITISKLGCNDEPETWRNVSCKNEDKKEEHESLHSCSNVKELIHVFEDLILVFNDFQNS